MEGQRYNSARDVPGGHRVRRRLFLAAVIAGHAAAVGYYGYRPSRLGPAAFEVGIDGPFAQSCTVAAPDAQGSPIKIRDVRIGKFRGLDGVTVHFSFNGERPDNRGFELVLALKDASGNDLVRRSVKCSDPRAYGSLGPFQSGGTWTIPTVRTRFFRCDNREIERASQMVLRLEEIPGKRVLARSL
jgi:hypothetical protein